MKPWYRWVNWWYVAAVEVGLLLGFLIWGWRT